MAKILLAGIDPAQVDFSDPGLPPGVTADFIRQGIEQAKAELAAQGHAVAHSFVPTDADALAGFAAELAAGDFAAVVIGGGVRHPPQNLELFEAMLNLIAQAPSKPAIVLVDHPDQSAGAVARVFERMARYTST